jgi:hypothetical protein
MEEGKIATAWPQLVRLKVNQCIDKNVCYLGVLLLDGAGSGAAPLLEPVVLLVQLNVRENGRR